MNLYQVCFKYQEGADDVPDRAHIVANSLAEVERLCKKHFPTLLIQEVSIMSTALNHQVLTTNFQQ